MNRQKVFGIGFGRTGTRSLNKALNELGIPATHWPHDKLTYNELANGNYRLTILERFDAVTDITLAQFYAQVDNEYAGSKFILTVRNRESWINRMTNSNASPKNHLIMRRKFLKSFRKLWRKSGDGFWNLFRKRFYVKLFDIPNSIHRIEFLRIATYGVIQRTNPVRMGFVYDLHIKNVLEYFKDRPEDLLVMNILDGDGWGKLCPFLDKPLPDTPFPHVGGKKKSVC